MKTKAARAFVLRGWHSGSPPCRRWALRPPFLAADLFIGAALPHAPARADESAAQSQRFARGPELHPPEQPQPGAAAWSNAVTFVATQSTTAFTNATGTNSIRFFRLKY